MAIADEERIRSTGVRQCKPPRGCVVNREQHGNKPRIQPRGVEPLIQKSQHACRFTSAVDNDFANGADGRGAVQGGAGPLPETLPRTRAKAASPVGREVEKASPK